MANERENLNSKLTIKDYISFPTGRFVQIKSIESYLNKLLGNIPPNKNSSYSSSSTTLGSYLTKKMVNLKWLTYDLNSGGGHYSFYPKGAFLYSIISRWLENLAIYNLRSQPIRTPYFYRWGSTGISQEAKPYFDRLYKVYGNDVKKIFVLRFASDFGTFMQIKNSRVYKTDLPVRLFENAPSFRFNQSGELGGIKRARSFSLLDTHSFTELKDEKMIEEYFYYFDKYKEILDKLLIPYYANFEIEKDYFENNKVLLKKYLANYVKPAHVRIVSKKKHYFVMKTFFITSAKLQLFNLQLDKENSLKYGLHYTSNRQKFPLGIVHTSMASVERWLLVFLYHALQTTPKILPYWLSIVQVRIIPISLNDMDLVEKTYKLLSKSHIRVDIDDRKKLLRDKIKKSETDWVPYTLVIGKNEESTKIFTVRGRGGELHTIKKSKLKKFFTGQLLESLYDINIPLPYKYLSGKPKYF